MTRRRLRQAAATVLAAVAAAALAAAAWVSRPVPIELLRSGLEPGTVLRDREGRVLRDARAVDGTRRRWVPLDRMDPDLLAAFLAAEDRRFYRHHGVDPLAAGRAARANLRAGHIVSGGSTITMQLARILRPAPRTWVGKVVQVLWALRLERHLDKQAILEQYLNRLPLGQGTNGVESAAALYFGATATELSLGQAALLAGLARAPSADNPLVSPGRARSRRAYALGRLRTAGYASAEAAGRAAAEPLMARSGGDGFLAPHFTTRVLRDLDRSRGALPSGWRTSLDLALQEAVEAEVRHTVETLADRGARQAAAVVLDNRSGDILAWVGSPDFWADTAGQVDMVVSPRQPGSALKPFLYALAFDRGFTPASILPDIARVYQTGTGPYRPRNYDRRYHGPVRAREALASSYNVPAVELASRLGVGTLLHTLRLAGFGSLGRSADHYGLGLALGNGDVTLLELANGYRALANGGVWRPVAWRASDPDRAPEPGRRLASPQAASLVLDILSDPAARIPGFGVETPLDFPFPAAAKTGTSRHFTDNWAVATTGGFTVAVWVGNFNGRPMDGVSGVTGAGPLLHRTVLATARRYPPGTLPTPVSAGAVPLAICRLSGMRAGPECPAETEWFVPGSEPTGRCDWHVGGAVVLPAEYAEWAGETEPAEPRAAPTSTAATRSTDRFQIVSPQDGDRYRIPPGADPRYATIALRAAGPGTAGARWWVDGARFVGGRWMLVPGSHRIRALGAGGQHAEVSITVE
ncbi:MAG TPA: penicillin-binding protein 1C [Gemmatimonadales bacterium]|nr:penicillin-binding protein 1C [Gemmatimonadales bacterium]